jgi:hypothetical protein
LKICRRFDLKGIEDAQVRHTRGVLIFVEIEVFDDGL